MKGTRTDSSQQLERQTVIRRSLLGLDYWLYRKAFFLPFCDYLKIFVSEPDPTVITLWDSADKQHPVFSTHPHFETNFCEEGGVIVPQSKYVVACYRSTGASFLSDKKARSAFEQLFAHPDFCSTPEGKLFARSLKTAADDVGAPRNEVARKCAFENIIEQKDWDATCEAMFSNVWKVLKDSPHFRLQGSGNLRTTNLFPFVFKAKDSKDKRESEITHQLQCVFSDTHRSFLHSNDAQASDLKEGFGRMFGQEAAMAFQTGTVTLADPLKGQDLSSAIGCPGLEMLAQMHRVYVPIHVEGAAWIVLLRFVQDSDIPGFYDRFHFYHDVIPRIGAMLRSESKSVYLGHIEKVFAQEIANPDYPSFVNRFNISCAGLVQSYPFPEVRLDEFHGDEPNRLTLPDGSSVCVATRKASWFDQQVDYDPLNSKDVVDACGRALRTVEESAKSFELEMRHQEHTIFQRLPTWDLQQAVKRPGSGLHSELTGKARKHVEDAKCLAEIMDIALNIAFGRQSALNLPTGVGQMLRWFEQHTMSKAIKADLTTPAVAKDFMLHESELPKAFTVLWNLWHNASKDYVLHKPNMFWVRTEWRGPQFVVTFVNEGCLPGKWVDYLLRPRANSPSDSKEIRGLIIVKTKMQALGWSFNQVNVQDDKTTIQVRIGDGREHNE
jgi:hypothetical protein